MPCCQQAYNINSTRERLESILRDAVQPESLPASVLDIVGLMKHVQDMEIRASAATEALHNAVRQERIRVDSQERIRADLSELRIMIPEGSSTVGVIESALERIRETSRDLLKLGYREKLWRWHWHEQGSTRVGPKLNMKYSK